MQLEQTTARLSEPSQPEASERVGPERQVGGNGGGDNTCSENTVEKDFKSALEDLRKAMSKVSSNIQFLEPITLKDGWDVEYVNVIARNLETQIDDVIKVRKLEVSPSYEKTWKACARNWFLAAHIFIDPLFNIALVWRL